MTTYRLLFSAFVLLCTGYLAVRMFYDGTVSLPTNTDSTLTPAVLALMFWEALTGLGSCAAISAAMNATAKSFPDKRRATVTGLVISGFGLSAFLFSTIAHIFFPGNTSDFLLLLALGTSIPPVIGILFIRIVPHAPHPNHVEPISGVGGEGVAEVFTPIIGPEAVDRLDDHIEEEDEHFSTGIRRSLSDTSMRQPLLQRLSMSFSRTPSASSSPQRMRSNSHPLTHMSDDNIAEDEDPQEMATRGLLSGQGKHKAALITHPDIHGVKLLKSSEFWLIFGILSLLSGTGLMYINNVGSITQALFIHDNGTWDEHAGSKIQASQVSITSLGNCFGRAAIGASADFFHNRTGAPRVYLVTMVAVLFLISQLVAMGIEDVKDLWLASTVVGLAYGGTFGLLPVVAIEWFGLNHFSQNWGFISISPALASNIFSLAFGKNYDAHASRPKRSPTPTSTPVARGGIPSELICTLGRECYIDSLRMTIVACCLAIILSVYAGWVDRRRNKTNRIEVWEADEPIDRS
ncbi:hypothetical protein FRB99_008335 [Tulasnella sp. 403]|nr:hypothetical protein FRB99_008335 [Tulasnella sp. 403]